MPTTIELADDQTAVVFKADGSHDLHMHKPDDEDAPLTQAQFYTLLVAVLLSDEEVMRFAAGKLDLAMKQAANKANASQFDTPTIIT